MGTEAELRRRKAVVTKTQRIRLKTVRTADSNENFKPGNFES